VNIRNIAVLGGLAAGAALAFAPLAAADTLGDAVSGEESLLNSIFVSDATLANVPASDYSLVDGFDVINAADIATVQGDGTTPFDFLVYGLNPADNLATDPGSYNVLNGALTEFSDAYNIELFSLLNPSAAIDTIPATDLIGSSETIADAFANGTGSASDVATYFFEFGANDLSGFLDLPAFFPSLIP
jgi:hypothetical protein